MSINWGTFWRVKRDMQEDKNYKDAKISDARRRYYDVFVFVYAIAAFLPYAAMVLVMYWAVYHISKLVFFTFTVTLFYFMFLHRFVRFFAKRRRAVKYFKKLRGSAKVTWLGHPYSHPFRPSGKADVKVETTNYVFYVMLLPAPRKMVQLMFGKGTVSYITRYNQHNKFYQVFNVKKKVRTFPLVFDVAPDPMSEKHVYKMILLCPTPREVFVPVKNELGGVGSEIGGIGIHNIASADRLIERDINAESQFY